jgi:hypothetical protein
MAGLILETESGPSRLRRVGIYCTPITAISLSVAVSTLGRISKAPRRPSKPISVISGGGNQSSFSAHFREH